MVHAMRRRRDHKWKTTHFLRRREKGRERGWGRRPSQAMIPPFPGILIDLLDLRALVGGLLGRSTSHSSHPRHVGHAPGHTARHASRARAAPERRQDRIDHGLELLLLRLVLLLLGHLFRVLVKATL